MTCRTPGVTPLVKEGRDVRVGPGFLGPGRLTVLCAPLQETTTVSLLYSQPNKKKGRNKKGLQRLKRQQNVLSAEEMEKDR